ncbi:MAG: hypothetical protein OXE86_08055 [Alphaproteobacteria bacterium]|nr:hypothetical protein [Alphaproteobacteria bacterium]
MRGTVAPEDLARCPWITLDYPASSPPGKIRPSLDTILVQLCAVTASSGAPCCTGHWRPVGRRHQPLVHLPRAGSAREPPRQSLPVDIDRARYRSGFFARQPTEDLSPFRVLGQNAVRYVARGCQEQL